MWYKAEHLGMSEIYNHPYRSMLLPESQNEIIDVPFNPFLISSDDTLHGLNQSKS